MSLRNFDPDDFLVRYWQQRPLLIRRALPDFQCPVDGDDLAGLACEEAVESRLVIERDGDWLLEHGPFAEERFARLPSERWSLLVQAVDQWIPEVTRLLEHFDFIPRWRIDDIMVSVAADGGGVGPHFDYYDVFLIQGSGRRRWRLGQRCDERTPLRAGSELRLLRDFETNDEFILEPGDILYLPPQIAHWGEAVGEDCITLSVGLRAPSAAELLTRWVEELTESLPEAERYRDPPDAFSGPGTITAAALERVRDMLDARLADTADTADWFGCLMTEPRYPELTGPPPEPLDTASLQRLLADGALRINLASRLAVSRRGGRALLFADGCRFDLDDDDSAAAAEMLAASLPGTVLAAPRFQNGSAALSLLLELYRNGTLVIEEG